jgi:hypothetical protein
VNEVRDIVARMLDHEPAPPLRPADEVLEIARRDKRRREWLGASTVGAVVLATVVGLVALAGPRSSSVPVGDPAAAPAALAAASHGAQLAAVLLAAVPDGYTPAAATTFGDDPTVYPTTVGGRSRILAAAVVPVFWGPAKGQLFAYLVYDGHPAIAPGADLCAEPTTGSCVPMTVHGVPIRVVTLTDPVQGYVVTATRFLDGGRLTVGASQGVPADDPAHGSPLSGPLLDGPAVAAITANPAMLP